MQPAERDHDTIAELQHVHETAQAYAQEMLRQTSPESPLDELNEIYRLRMMEKFAAFGLSYDVTDDDCRQALEMIEAISANWRLVGFTDLFRRVVAMLNLDVIEPPTSAVN